MKSYTDIEESKQLAEILPIENADQTWVRVAIAGANLDVPEEMEYRHNGDVPFILSSKFGVPCWSLAALIDILPHRIDDSYELVMGKLSDIGGWEVMYMYYDVDDYVEPHTKYRVIHSNSIDACFEMIVKLHEEKLL